MGDVVTHQHCHVETRSVAAQPAGYAVQEGRVPDFHAHPLQRFGGRTGVLAPGRYEHNVGAALQQQADQIDLAQ